MAAPDVSTKLVTGEELMAMGDIGPCELVEGRIVEMTPTEPSHGRIESRFDHALSEFVREKDLGEVMVGEVGLYTRRDPDTVRAADILFISHERYGRATPDSYLDVAPELIVEILSPGDRWADVQEKLREYFEAGVDVVILVEPEAKIVSVYRSTTEIEEFGGEDELTVPDLLPGFSLPLPHLFGSS